MREKKNKFIEKGSKSLSNNRFQKNKFAQKEKEDKKNIKKNDKNIQKMLQKIKLLKKKKKKFNLIKI